jgi:hypothetical protein
MAPPGSSTSRWKPLPQAPLFYRGAGLSKSGAAASSATRTTYLFSIEQHNKRTHTCQKRNYRKKNKTRKTKKQGNEETGKSIISISSPTLPGKRRRASYLPFNFIRGIDLLAGVRRRGNMRCVLDYCRRRQCVGACSAQRFVRLICVGRTPPPT